jgi:hypothetical protein
MDVGEPHCADYVYVWTAAAQSGAQSGGQSGGQSGARARVVAASIAGDAPDAADPTLYPSDHLAVCVDLVIS